MQMHTHTLIGYIDYIVHYILLYILTTSYYAYIYNIHTNICLHQTHPGHAGLFLRTDRNGGHRGAF